LALETGFGKSAMQALLGFGYLLTVLHEKHLGGHIEFNFQLLLLLLLLFLVHDISYRVRIIHLSWMKAV
jgi:hypothetical protein